MEPFDIRGKLPEGTTAARGERRHRQDLHRRRAGHPVRRRGGGPARRDAGHHLRPRRQPGAPRAGPRPAGRGGAGAGRPGHRRPRQPAAGPPARGRRRRARGHAAPAARRAGRVRRGDHRDHPPVLPAGAALARGRRRHRRRARRWWNRSTTSSSRWSTTSTSAATATSSSGRRSTGPARSTWPAPPSATRSRCWCRPTTTRPTRVAPGSASPTRSAPRSTAASAGWGSSATTTCSAGWPPPWRRPTPRPATGCGRAGGSCWSTSSRTPTRCSGRSSTGRSPATPRWCSSATRSRPSTRSAAATW